MLLINDDFINSVSLDFKKVQDVVKQSGLCAAALADMTHYLYLLIWLFSHCTLFQTSIKLDFSMHTELNLKLKFCCFK